MKNQETKERCDDKIASCERERWWGIVRMVLALGGSRNLWGHIEGGWVAWVVQ